MSTHCSPLLAGILVASTVPLFRYGLVHVLARSFAEYPLHEAATKAELLDATSNLLPELVIMTTSLPDTPAETVNLLTALRERQPKLAVVVLVDPVTTPESAVLRLLRQQVNGLLLHTASPEEVCETVAAVLQRGQCYNEYTIGLLQSQLHHRSLPRATESFSERQIEVLQLIVEDFSNEEIADHLCTSVRTVEYHRSQMLQKAGTRTTLGLVLFAQRQGLLATASARPSGVPWGPALRLARA